MSMALEVGNSERDNFTDIQFEARQFKHHFCRKGQSKRVKERALHVHQTNTKHFIAKLFA